MFRVPARRSRLVAIPVVAAIAAVPLALASPSDGSDPSLTVTLARGATGWLAATVHGTPGSVVTLREGRRAAGTLTLDSAGSGAAPRLLPWRCDRLTRHVVATTSAPDGTTSTATAAATTPSCASRFAVSAAPRRPRAGRGLRVAVADRWGVGDAAPMACLRPADGRRTCRAVRLAEGERHGAVRLMPRLAGKAVLTVTAGGTAVLRRRLHVRPAGGHVRVLATGDSMIQIIDSFLRSRLPGATVVSDAHISTGLTKPWMLDWEAHARSSAAGFRPDATVMFIGPNDGYALGTAPCCGADWAKAYAQRARSVMRSYLRGGRGRLYWILLPAARDATFQRIFRGVNAGLRRAARSFHHGVRLIDLGPVLTPSGHFQSTATWQGHAVGVRQGDGVHLSTTGASIAATLIIRALRRDGLA